MVLPFVRHDRRDDRCVPISSPKALLTEIRYRLRLVLGRNILGMLASLSCAESEWRGSSLGSSSGASCTCSARRSSSSSMGHMTWVRSRSPSNGSRLGLSQNTVGVRRVATPPSHFLVVGFRCFWKIYHRSSTWITGRPFGCRECSICSTGRSIRQIGGLPLCNIVLGSSLNGLLVIVL